MSLAKYTCIALCVGLGLSLSVNAGGRNNLLAPADKSKRSIEDERPVDEEVKNEGLQQTLDLNFSPEHREKLRKVLDDFARSNDASHEKIEERRRAMQDSIEARFFEADTDGDGTIDRQEATERLPQIARHFNAVDTNQDNLISLGELVEAQARILERRKATEVMLEEEKQQKLLEAEPPPVGKRKNKAKNKQATINAKKPAL